ncbi:MAG: DMT family transporter [Candidatus Zixiibacteriota bacterium]
MVNTLLIASLCLIWGATWVVIKIGLSDAPPFYSAGFRFAVAALVLAVVVLLRRRAWPRDRRTLGWILLPGVFMYFGSYAAVYYAEQYINAALASIIFSSFPFFVALGAHFYLPGERLSARKVAGLIIGFSGIVVIFGDGLTRPTPELWWAMLIMLASPISSAIASIMVKRHLTGEDPSTVNLLQMLVGVAILFPFAMVTEQIDSLRWTPTFIGTVLFLGILGSAYTFATYYHLLKTIEATRMSLIAFVTPVVAAILGWLILDERLRLSAIIGALLVFAGIYIVNVMAEKKPPARLKRFHQTATRQAA